ncbi:pirin family protein [Inmirania thermothiophila]|uniref:Pirin N-terminal domain-containing protein n=1 Tax=Inmirania thermothiophila TaxID=1750597 RepID=A0A3N1Y6X6_9GAMM|nr:pirin family protein [Inmirania thermothiophila]ROR34574.1 hypothetical protein EDC57_0472 [Inmirania thermothiophila]
MAEETGTVGRPRAVETVVVGRPVTEGAGVRLLRVFGEARLQRRLDPFLLLDEFRSDDPADYRAGFPAHPHRGFETVTYLLAGALRHRDSSGGGGRLGPGDVQWMTAGRGIVHEEMPDQGEGLLHGFQLWVNLPAAHKMAAPRYRHVPAAAIPQLAPAPGATVRLVAGRLAGAEGPVVDVVTGPVYADLALAPGAVLALPLDEALNGFLYVYEGTAEVGPAPAARRVGPRALAVLARAGDGLRVAAGPAGARLLLAAARPIGEPIVQWGPFVMNTREEIEQALADYRAGRLG